MYEILAPRSSVTGGARFGGRILAAGIVIEVAAAHDPRGFQG